MPAEALIYVADLGHFPYGPRSQSQVRGLALDIIGMLAAMDTKLVVIACNTATAAALHVARERFDIPVVGVIAPGAQAAAAATRNGRVAVLSTEGTRASGEYVHAIKEANPGIAVLSEVAADLVEIVEDGDADTARADAALAPVLRRIVDWRADTLVLGCTHYPLLRPALRRLIGNRRLRVVDSADTTAARVKRIVAVNRIGADGAARERPPVPGGADRDAGHRGPGTVPHQCGPDLRRAPPGTAPGAAGAAGDSSGCGVMSIAAEELLEPISQGAAGV